jgi:two-component system, response regulator / RNA-binding antiterminator
MKVMLIDEDRGRAALLKQALLDSGYQISAVIHTNEDLLKKTFEIECDVILIDMESPNRDTLEYLTSLKKEQAKPVVILAENDDRQLIESAVKAGVSAYVVDGFSQKRLKAILEVAIARFREYHAMREELENTKHKLAERKSIEKAKGILMKHKGFDEETAYQTLRKMAMDKHLKMVEVAEQIINVSELLI